MSFYLICRGLLSSLESQTALPMVNINRGMLNYFVIFQCCGDVYVLKAVMIAESNFQLFKPLHCCQTLVAHRKPFTQIRFQFPGELNLETQGCQSGAPTSGPRQQAPFGPLKLHNDSCGYSTIVMLGHIITYSYAKDGGQREDLPLCGFYHDPLRPQHLCLVRYEVHLLMLASNNFSKPVHLISKPYGLK